MLASIVGFLVRELLKNLDKETIKEFIDTGLDMIENKIDSTETTLDNTAIEPLIDLIRDTLDIADEDYGKDKVE